MSYTAYMTYTVDVRGLRKSFGSVTALEALDLQVDVGEIVALLGPNGAGKTTAVRILSTLLRADAGRATIAGHDLGTDARRVRASISLTGQYAAVDGLLTGRENLLMMGRLRHVPRAVRTSRTAELLDRFDLTDEADRRVATYSGGTRRRLDLAMSLVVVPTVLFLDEPTTGLDPRGRGEVWDAVARLAGSGVSVLLTTQYLDEADRLADRVVVIDHGRVVAQGSPADLKAQVGSETVQFTFASADAARSAAGLIASILPAAASEPIVDDAAATVKVGTDGSADAVRRTLDHLARIGVPAERLVLHRPTLDEVFLTLTGSPDSHTRTATLQGADR